MSNYEELSQPIAYTDREELDSKENDSYAALWFIPHGCGQDIALYSQECVIALIDERGKLRERVEALHKQAIKDGSRITELEQRLQQPMPKGFSHQDGAIHALLGSNDVMISHIKRNGVHGIAFSPVPAGKKEIGINFDSDIAGKFIDEIGVVFTVESTSVQSLELLKEAVQMAIDGFKVEGESK